MSKGVIFMLIIGSDVWNTRIFCLKRSKIKKKEESFMKNIFKYLSAFAIAGVLGLQVVNAEKVNECKPDQEVHTNYYMFLEVDTADSMKKIIDALTVEFPFNIYTGANKYNNIKGADQPPKNTGHVDIVESGTTGEAADGSITWTVADFWRKYQKGVTGRNSQTLVFDNGTEHYLYHDRWYVYEDDRFEGGAEKNYSDGNVHASLITYIQQNYDNLENSALVRSGTQLPATHINMPNNLFDTTDTSTRWTISRAYRKGEVTALTGVPLNNTMYVYAPAAYYVKYCGPKVSQTAEKKIEYDPNGNGVVNTPGNQTFTENCTYLSSEKPARTGYQFIGWAKSATSTGADYQPGDEYCGDSIKLYAVWKEDQTGPFKVTYDANGGKDAPATQTGTAPNQCITIPANQKPTLTGNTFLGWSTNKDAREPDKDYAPGKDYCGQRGDITLYAVWRPDTGINAHLIAFGIVAIGAAGALIVAKKKDLFKQI